MWLAQDLAAGWGKADTRKWVTASSISCSLFSYMKRVWTLPDIGHPQQLTLGQMPQDWGVSLCYLPSSPSPWTTICALPVPPTTPPSCILCLTPASSHLDWSVMWFPAINQKGTSSPKFHVLCYQSFLSTKGTKPCYTHEREKEREREKRRRRRRRRGSRQEERHRDRQKRTSSEYPKSKSRWRHVSRICLLLTSGQMMAESPLFIPPPP